MLAVFIRIALRWLAGALVARGVLTTESTMIFDDPDVQRGVELGLGLAVGAVTEGWYYLAQRYGWSK